MRPRNRSGRAKMRREGWSAGLETTVATERMRRLKGTSARARGERQKKRPRSAARKEAMRSRKEAKTSQAAAQAGTE